jgi:hypothetical protein
MPECRQHVEKVRSNLTFVSFLLRANEGFFDWIITGYFYAAVHLMEAYFDLSGAKHYRRHLYRRQAINADGKIRHLFAAYRSLETYSEVARYGVKRFDVSYVKTRVVPKFEKIRGEIGQFDPSLSV